MSNPQDAPVAWPDEASESLFSQLRHAVQRVLGDTEVGHRVLEICDQFETERRSILNCRVPGSVVVAVIGPTGQGKTWLVRQLIDDRSVVDALRSGDRLGDATVDVSWIGPSAPVDLDRDHERHLHCDAEAMLPLGPEYLLLDTPGATDHDSQVVKLAREALSMASVHILVVRRDHLRTHAASDLVFASEGALVLPVVNIVRNRDAELTKDIDAFCAALSRAAPASEILPPVTVDDFDVTSDEATVSRETTEAISRSLRPILSADGAANRRQRARLSAVDRRFRAALHRTVSQELPQLMRAVNHLHDAAQKLPADVAYSLMGGGASLRAGLRSRLRLSLLTDTAAIWFPYKSVVGLLNLTHGAWDRLVLSLSGSLPSLITSAWASAQNLRQMQSLQTQASDGVRQQCAALVRDRLGPLVRRFGQELSHLKSDWAASASHSRTSAAAGTNSTSEHNVAQAALSGVDQLQQTSQQIVDEEIEHAAIRPLTAQLLGAGGTAIFWALFSGPIIALYRTYFDATMSLGQDGEHSLEKFPAPEWSMLFTAIMLSLIPTAIYAMLVVTFTQNHRRVTQCAERIAQRHKQEILQLQESGVLRLQFDDQMLADAEFLVSTANPPQSMSRVSQ